MAPWAGRYLHRRAITGIVPDKVAWKPSKNMRGPHDDPGNRVSTYRPPDLEDLHPEVAELLDAEVWRHGPDWSAGPTAGGPFRNAAVLSAWLADRT